MLDIPQDQILADFALTERATDRLVADWKLANPDRVLRWPGYGRAPTEIMRLVLADLTTTYGSVGAYLTDQVGIDAHTTERLRARLLDGRPVRAR